MDLTSVSNEWDIQFMDQWLDDNRFSPMRPSGEFSPTLSLPVRDPNALVQSSGIDYGLGIYPDAFSGPDHSDNSNLSVPVRGKSAKPPTETVPLGLSQSATSSAGGGSGADQSSLQQKLQRLIESVDKIERRLSAIQRDQSAIQRDQNAMKKWSVELSTTVNDVQLKQEGLSPLQKHFGLVLGPKYRERPG